VVDVEKYSDGMDGGLFTRHFSLQSGQATAANAATDYQIIGDFLRSMANPVRLTLLHLLVQGELPVGELAARVGLSQSAVSQHLARLRQQRLVMMRREAQTIYYRCESVQVKIILSALDDIFPRNG
jgi:DNA-binding transcriptional ArsR family regulator